MRALKRYLATREDNLPWLLISERQAQLTRQAVNYIVRIAGESAKLGRVWPHMLRHSCGHYLADKSTDLRTMRGYLGHRDPKYTAQTLITSMPLAMNSSVIGSARSATFPSAERSSYSMFSPSV
jgi:site-specific recombinase XerD